MTKALEDEFNLPRLEDALKEQAAKNQSPEDPQTNEEVDRMATALANLDTAALARKTDPAGVEEHQSEADEIYEQAMKSYKDLMDLGFNIEPKNAGPNAFMPGLKALEIALKASQSKSNKKMERIRLIMEQEAHDREMNQDVEDGEIVDNGGASITANRNDLMQKIRKGEI